MLLSQSPRRLASEIVRGTGEKYQFTVLAFTYAH